ncbi:TRAP transporter large permease (plasmid) [Azospirillum baldaniorum]|uniref:TRAP transporter large permease protein n=3 Tax=Azospirillum TaxID=191 RepID=A0A9P1NQP3_9PROT|nr:MULTISPECIES: TRAP transporter large permease [Azospirillum]TWA81750.1 tripartite ATP-independent transporter DctM subunit [Azospirillum brasilense]AWJ93921.1 TRAP transporter large permease [Azospirillum baldaniorum]QCN98401.1 TRAP transporter large permease [Azospirillum argentinense]QCO05713.1 TRAP transporter large permease [Azospirillum argentinense]CCD02096.1 putative TRAP dicarboxylate transporter,permease component (DctM) [Azospirillum baldaniorum]
MIPLLLFAGFFLLLFLGVPIGAGLALAGAVAIALEGSGFLSLSTTVYTGVAKYPLLAIPMFVLTGLIFERSGVAARLVAFALAVVGKRQGALPAVAIVVAMFMGGISGSGPATSAAVGAVMTAAMLKEGYPRAFTASVIGAAAATDILIPPSIAFIVYSILVPQASVPALFAAGIVPGILAGLALIVPAVWLSRRHGFGEVARDGETRPPLWPAFREAVWGLMAPVVILGGLRGGLFTPTEAAVVAAAYGLFVGFFVYRTLTLRDLYGLLVEAAEVSGVILTVVALAGVFAWATATLGIIDPVARGILALGIGEYGVLALLIAVLVVIGMFLDGVSTFLILLPILVPIANHFQWDLVWFGVILTMKLAIGQFTPPMAVNLMVTCKIAGTTMEATVRWVGWLIVAMFVALALVAALPQLALWIPHTLGYE